MPAAIRGVDAFTGWEKACEREKERTMGKDHRGTKRRKKQHPKERKDPNAAQTLG